MKKAISWFIPNATLVTLFILITIVFYEQDTLRNKLNIEQHILNIWTGLILILAALFIYSLLKKRNQILNWTSFITFTGCAILATKIYFEVNDGQAILFPIIYFFLTFITLYKIFFLNS